MTTATQAHESLRGQYDRDGVVSVRGVLTSVEIDHLRATFMDEVQRDRSLSSNDLIPAGDPLATFPRLMHPHRVPDRPAGRAALDLMLDRRITDVVEQLIGPAMGAQSMFYFKPPGARGQAMHQDNLFLRAHPETCLAAWIAVDDADAANGGLSVVPGSHRMEIVCPEPADPELSFTNGRVPTPAGLSAVQTRLAAGDILFFHGSVVHGSLPNTTSSRFRRSLIFHYVPAASTEIAANYQPLVRLDGREVRIGTAVGGGPCGEGFTPTGTA